MIFVLTNTTLVKKALHICPCRHCFQEDLKKAKALETSPGGAATASAEKKMSFTGAV